VWCDADPAALPAEPAGLAHLLMVDNPPHHPEGDFVLDAQGLLQTQGSPRLTFSGTGVFRRQLLEGRRESAGSEGAAPAFKLRELLLPAIARGAVSGSRHRGEWTDVGTPERLAQIDAALGGPGPRLDQGEAGLAGS
jgi:MurNAc alpha-1-phosphate uridylyltransferase